MHLGMGHVVAPVSKMADMSASLLSENQPKNGKNMQLEFASRKALSSVQWLPGTLEF